MVIVCQYFSKGIIKRERDFELEFSTLGIVFDQPMSRTKKHPIETQTVAIRTTPKRNSPADFMRSQMPFCYKIKMEDDEDDDL